jgi:CheY-like chemotaxis protein
MARDARGGPDRSRAFTEPDGGTTDLSNDYLNHYVEVLLLIEMAPHDPSVSADLIDWWPVSYVEYFSSSRLDHAFRAKAAYEALPSEDRRRFERLVAAMETLATLAVFALQPPCAPDRASVVADATAPVLRRLISAAGAFLESGGRQPFPDDLPVNEAEDVINTIIGGRSTATPAASQAQVPAPKPDASTAINILVVEDDAMLRELYRRALRRAGYQVLTADGGENALGILQRWGERIDWLFTDIRLSGQIDGWAVGSAFSLNHPRRPVVYGSGFEPDGSRQVANSVFLRKPINVGELIAAFKQLSADGHTPTP